MAQQFQTDSGTLIIPSASATWTVATENSGLATSGVIALVGEADAGPDYTLETALDQNSFGPDQISDVLAKYRSGPVVDAFRIAATPANDPNITGSPSRIVIVKTNVSVRATGSMLKYGGGAYATLADKNYGKPGNMSYWQTVAATTEVVPTTGAFTYIPTVSSCGVEFRVNGGAAVAYTVAANQTPTAFVSGVNALSGVYSDTTVCGVARVVIPTVTPGTVDLVPVGSTAVIGLTSSVGWTTIPTVGDTLIIVTGSTLKGAASINEGAYVVTAADATTITATKLSDAGHVGGADGVVALPLAAVSGAAAAASFAVYSPVVISLEAANPSLGLGKSLEIAQLPGSPAAALLECCCFVLGTSTKVSWISKTGAAYVLTSGVEYSANLKVNRQLDNVQEELISGGEVALKLGYAGTSASAVIDKTLGTLTLTIVGGSGTYGLTPVTLVLADYPTLADLANFLDSHTGYSCDLGNNLLGQLPSTALDGGTTTSPLTFTFASKWGEETGRIKIDAYRFFNKISNESVLVQLLNSSNVNAAAVAGLPAPTTAYSYLSGGDKGGTLQNGVILAIDACEKIRCNFLVPCFSRDASVDKLAGLTESTSTYAIDAINAYCRTHVLKMSTLKKRRNRQAFLSKKDTFANARLASSNIASFRCAMTFQDCKAVGSDGAIHQYAPWMNAVDAAGMQAAGFYRGIVRKYANISGAVQAAADFDDQDDTAMENALLSGLLPLRHSESGGWYWVSDQTTYGKDSNFVLNSIQACYVADLIAMTSATRMENAFVGQSLADVSAPLAKAFFETIMGDFFKLKLIAASDDGAPRGFKSVVIRISGTSMIVSAEMKLAGCIYFIPISFLVSQVQQSA